MMTKGQRMHQRIRAEERIVRAAMRWYRTQTKLFFDPHGKATDPLHILQRACVTLAIVNKKKSKA